MRFWPNSKPLCGIPAASDNTSDDTYLQTEIKVFQSERMAASLVILRSVTGIEPLS